METIAAVLPWIQIILSVLLIISVLLQQNEAGLGAGFGGSGGSFQRTRRGFERTLMQITVVLGVLFALSALMTLFLR